MPRPRVSELWIVALSLVVAQARHRKTSNLLARWSNRPPRAALDANSGPTGLLARLPDVPLDRARVLANQLSALSRLRAHFGSSHAPFPAAWAARRSWPRAPDAAGGRSPPPPTLALVCWSAAPFVVGKDPSIRSVTAGGGAGGGWRSACVSPVGVQRQLLFCSGCLGLALPSGQQFKEPGELFEWLIVCIESH